MSDQDLGLAIPIAPNSLCLELDAQPLRDSIDEVEIRDDRRDAVDLLVGQPGFTEDRDVLRPDFCGASGQGESVVEHRAKARRHLGAVRISRDPVRCARSTSGSIPWIQITRDPSSAGVT